MSLLKSWKFWVLAYRCAAVGAGAVVYPEQLPVAGALSHHVVRRARTGLEPGRRIRRPAFARTRRFLRRRRLRPGALYRTRRSRLDCRFSRGGCGHHVRRVIGAIAFRLRGPYFTLATIAFGEVLRLTATNLNVTGGAIGLTMPRLFVGQDVLALVLSGRRGPDGHCVSGQLLDLALALRLLPHGHPRRRRHRQRRGHQHRALQAAGAADERVSDRAGRRALRQRVPVHCSGQHSHA